MSPPMLIDSCDPEVTGCSAVAKACCMPPFVFVEEREEEDTMFSITSTMQEEKPCTSLGSPPPKKRKSNRVLDFLKRETEKEEESFHATPEFMKSITNRLLDLFEQLIKKG